MDKVPLPIYFDGDHYDAWTERTVDIPFYKDQVEKYGDPVLELGCGTGRITIPLAKEGYDIIGLDLSKELLKKAKKKAKKENVAITWIEGDMKNFSLHQNFNLIFIPFNTIQHILSLKNLERVLENVKRHLKPDGGFIVEFFNPDLDILSRDPQKEHEVMEYDNPDGEGKVKITEKTSYEKAEQMLHLTWFYNFADRRVAREWTSRIWFPKEVDAIFRYNDFEIEHKYGDFDGSPFTNNSGQQIVVCKKG